ncbi:asparagine synthase (glutamine-hydrolyzing) [bacterium]|nr:asparagine synthase (glutamine-hydrolyzing) [bacterium]MCB2201949.1 asparagine synthase (glutamine-hydrolyzing) [bacterium]
MCGIAGFFAADELDSNASEHLKNMITVLQHRGPDGCGYHVDRKNRLAMGHGRLSIIDLEGGSQPLSRRTPSLVMTVNGEFYDYKRIRANLNCDGERFVTKSDSEIALHLYKRHGLAFVEHLRGEFGFALYDEAEDRLILVRDRFGIKPLFFHVGRNRVYYGSEVKAVLAHSDVPRRLDTKAVLHQLMHTMIPGTSAFEGIQAVKPGHMVIVQRRGESLDITERRYWDMEFPHREEHRQHESAEEYIEQVRASLIESVSLRLEADVPVGCYLSGGIDSCSMLGIASAVQQSPVKAYTISFDNDAYDESHIAREMAQRVNADQEVLNLTATDLYGDNYLRTVWHAERTFYNTLGVAKWCMSRRVRESGYKTVVTGEGADEMFGGYPAFKRDMLLYGADDASAGEAESHRKLMDETNKLFRGAILAEEQVSHPAFERLCGFTPSWIQPWMHTLELARPLLHDDLQAELNGYDPIEAIADSFDPGMIEGRHHLDIAQYTWIKTMLECQILNWGGDRVDMANSMESRPAFLDHTVAEVARHIPPHMRINGNVEKWVLREAMKHVLPEVLYKREKFAFMAPPGHTDMTKQRALRELLDTHMNDQEVRTAGLFDPGRLRTFVEEYERDTDSVSLVRKDALMNHLLCLHVLHQQYVQEVHTPEAVAV